MNFLHILFVFETEKTLKCVPLKLKESLVLLCGNNFL